MTAFWRDLRAASAAEFALVLPAALLLLFGVIDVGRYVWHLNQYEKAVQLGARYAVATQVVATPLKTADYSSIVCPGATGTLKAGDTICAEAMRSLTCTSSSCTCDTSTTSGVCSAASGTTFNATAFSNIVSRMRVASKRIGTSNVIVEYAGSGIGYLGDPGITSDCSTTSSGGGTTIPVECQLPDAAPIVTVKLTSLRYYPITLSLVGVGVPYPQFSYSLTMEDGDGAVAS